MTAMPITYLDSDALLHVARAVMNKVTVRDAGLLASAAARPMATFAGEEAYPDVPTKAAALLHSLARNHALLDGNKRLAWASAMVFLELNGWRLEVSTEWAVELVVGVARGHVDVDDIADGFRRHRR